VAKKTKPKKKTKDAIPGFGWDVVVAVDPMCLAMTTPLM
jgi:hypothetical protein